VSSKTKGASPNNRAHATMEDVARAAGVSRALVSLVMRESPKVSEKRRRRVLKAAERLGYRPNAMARHLASRRTQTLGVLLNELHNPFYAEIMDGVEEVADELDYRLLIGTSGRRPGGEERAIETFLELRTDGVVLVGPRLPSQRIVATASSVPVAVVARDVRSPLVDTVRNNERVGAELVVSHLAGLGHRRIVHIDGGRGAGAAARRLAYEGAMRRAGLGAEIRVLSGDYTDIAGVRAATELLAAGDLPTAIFAANDVVAAGAQERLEDSGVRVPDDVSIVGCDNVFIAALHHISLTTVHQPRPEMGRLAVRALLERIDGTRTTPVRHLLAPSLVVRTSTGAPRDDLDAGSGGASRAGS
jgi:DNA-binding LacI/PurR family transcriptional regulator